MRACTGPQVSQSSQSTDGVRLLRMLTYACLNAMNSLNLPKVAARVLIALSLGFLRQSYISAVVSYYSCSQNSFAKTSIAFEPEKLSETFRHWVNSQIDSFTSTHVPLIMYKGYPHSDQLSNLHTPHLTSLLNFDCVSQLYQQTILDPVPPRSTL